MQGDLQALHPQKSSGARTGNSMRLDLQLALYFVFHQSFEIYLKRYAPLGQQISKANIVSSNLRAYAHLEIQKRFCDKQRWCQDKGIFPVKWMALLKLSKNIATHAVRLRFSWAAPKGNLVFRPTACFCDKFHGSYKSRCRSTGPALHPRSIKTPFVLRF